MKWSSLSQHSEFNTKVKSIYRALSFRPVLVIGTIVLSLFTAVLEGIGLSFIIPIIQLAQQDGSAPSDAGRFVEAFETVYQAMGIPMTLEYLIVGVSIVMAVRYSGTFLVTWLKAAVETYYKQKLQMEIFDRVITARVNVIDDRGTDEVLNTIVTQSRAAGQVVLQFITFVEQLLLSFVYLSITLYLAPELTVAAAVLLGGVTALVRYGLEGGYDIGDRVRLANKDIQTVTQTTVHGLRDIKLFNMGPAMFDRFQETVNWFTRSNILLRRNQAAMNSIHQGITAIMMFILVYLALRFTQLSIGSLGLFLFAMFRLSPRISILNNTYYNLQGKLPHLVRTHEFIYTLEAQQEPVADGHEPTPDTIDEIAFSNVAFAYDDETVLDDVSFEVDSGEFAAFVGPSGAGKSTIVSLLAQFYTPDEGEITANGIPISAFDIATWREEIALVRQDPYLFDKTLEENITVGNPTASDEKMRAAASAAGVTEFVDELPDGFDTPLGEDGIKLSGGQRQRVAIARSLLKETGVLILDEATSDLDRELEAQVHNNITEQSDDKILIVVAHRLSTVRDADRIYTMDEGEIVEVGPHEELTAKGGTYAQLYNTKF